MNRKRFLLAIPVVLVFLFFEFKVIPTLKEVNWAWRKPVLSPVNPENNKKFVLLSRLNEKKITVVKDPILNQDTGNLEVVLLVDGVTVKTLFSPKINFDGQITSLQLIFKEVRIDERIKAGDRPKLVDLSGDKPYVSF
ncbi:MAG: hypothetical protein ABID04_01080 [Patescibacteria group bacterium]